MKSLSRFDVFIWGTCFFVSVFTFSASNSAYLLLGQCRLFSLFVFLMGWLLFSLCRNKRSSTEAYVHTLAQEQREVYHAEMRRYLRSVNVRLDGVLVSLKIIIVGLALYMLTIVIECLAIINRVLMG